MKRTLLTTIISALMAASAVFGQQHQQTMSFTGPTAWVPGTSVSLDVFLTFSGYDAIGLSYWLEVQNPVAPFLLITDVQNFTWGGPPPPLPIPFICGGDEYCGSAFGFGGSGNPVGPGTYQVTRITFSLDANAPIGSYTLRTTSEAPRISEVTDTDFNDNNINPPGTFVFQVVPEPSTLALFCLAAVGSGVLVFHRRNR